jgi:hypothetical protein
VFNRVAPTLAAAFVGFLGCEVLVGVVIEAVAYRHGSLWM